MFTKMGTQCFCALLMKPGISTVQKHLVWRVAQNNIPAKCKVVLTLFNPVPHSLSELKSCKYSLSICSGSNSVPQKTHVHPGIQNVNLLGNRVFAYAIS